MADNENQAEMAPTPDGGTPQGETAPKPEDLAAELERTRIALKQANKEAADRRKRLEALEQAEAERKQAEMTEAQKLQAKLDKLEAERTDALAKANARILRAEILAKAAGQFHDAEDVFLALRDKLSVDENGNVDGLDEALKDLAKAKPHWVKKAAAPKLSPGNPGDNATGNGETEAQRRARLYGGGGSILDPNWAAQKGGGVLFVTKD